MVGQESWKHAMEGCHQQGAECRSTTTKLFRRLREDESLEEYTRIPYHIVFDVKFDLRCKARLVGGGNFTTADKEETTQD